MGFPLPKERIASTESTLGLSFPLSYLARLVRNNGGELVVGDECWRLFPFRDDTDRKRLARTCNDVVTETMKLREWGSFPATAVAIAADGCGNALVLLPRADGTKRLAEAVYDWFHETGELTKLADSFDELE